MVSTEERMQILKLIAEGKISPEEGAQLLEVLEGNVGSPANEPAAPMPGGRPSRWFRVRVTDTDSGRTRVNVRLPIGLVQAGLKMGAKFSPEVQGLDMEQLQQFINAGTVGQVVDVYDDQDGEHIEVYVE